MSQILRYRTDLELCGRNSSLAVVVFLYSKYYCYISEVVFGFPVAIIIISSTTFASIRISFSGTNANGFRFSSPILSNFTAC